MTEIYGHHTKEQVALAFAYAPVILEKLINKGVRLPRFELFADASGTLHLGGRGEVTQQQYDFACELIKSNRMTSGKIVGIDFCCGLVSAAVEAHDADK